MNHDLLSIVLKDIDFWLYQQPNLQNLEVNPDPQQWLCKSINTPWGLHSMGSSQLPIGIPQGPFLQLPFATFNSNILLRSFIYLF